jgi:hypothetical protein
MEARFAASTCAVPIASRCGMSATVDRRHPKKLSANVENLTGTSAGDQRVRDNGSTTAS